MSRPPIPSTVIDRGINRHRNATIEVPAAAYGGFVMRRTGVSDRAASLRAERRLAALDEAHFAEIDVAMLYIEEARSRAERAAEALRRAGAEPHLVEAVEQAEAEISNVARRLRQGTLFAVPKEQLTL